MDAILPHTPILRDMLRTETMILAQDHSYAQQQHRRHHHSYHDQYLFHFRSFRSTMPISAAKIQFFFHICKRARTFL